MRDEKLIVRVSRAELLQVEKVAKSLKATRSEIVRAALAEFAKSRGIEPPSQIAGALELTKE